MASRHQVREKEGTEPTQYISVGTDAQGRLLEMCAVRTLAGDTMIYHCNTAQRPMLRELRLI